MVRWYIMSKVLIKNGILYTMSAIGNLKGDLLIENGKIREISENIKCDNADKIIDADGLNVLPGIVDAHTHLGVMDYNHFPPMNDDGNDMTSTNTPALKAIYGVDPSVKDFKRAYTHGITSVVITEGSGNVINGWAFATKTYGNDIFDMVMRNPCAVKVALGGSPKKYHAWFNQAPFTRMGTAAAFRRTLLKARKYLNDKKEGKDSKYDRELEALLPVLRREVPFKIHCTQYDMMTSIDICKEFNVRFSLDHAWGATDYIDEIVESGCYICYGPIGTRRADGEYRKSDIEALKTLDEKGVICSVITDAPIFSSEAIFHYLGEAVREGLDINRALRMITINPAIIAGIDDRVGSLEVGKDADIAIFDGIPSLDTRAKTVYTLSEGLIIYEAR